MIHLELGDCREILSAYPENFADACVTDPPYELGFMGSEWDSTGVAFDPKTWAAILRVLKPGAALLAFGGTRTFHRIACAIEDAGFEVRDCLSWLYGTGFPKSLNLGDGRGTALKPAWEPITLARKPLIGTVAGNVDAFGTGALNIDACRIPHGNDVDLSLKYRLQEANGTISFSKGPIGTDIVPYKPGGRWPANVCLDESAAVELDAQSGISVSDAHVRHNRKRSSFAKRCVHACRIPGALPVFSTVRKPPQPSAKKAARHCP
jgi:hypothetical protein